MKEKLCKMDVSSRQKSKLCNLCQSQTEKILLFYYIYCKCSLIINLVSNIFSTMSIPIIPAINKSLGVITEFYLHCSPEPVSQTELDKTTSRGELDWSLFIKLRQLRNPIKVMAHWYCKHGTNATHFKVFLVIGYFSTC